MMGTRETDCGNISKGEQCALGFDHGGHEHISASGRSWPAHVPWNPIDGYQPKPLKTSAIEQSATL